MLLNDIYKKIARALYVLKEINPESLCNMLRIAFKRNLILHTKRGSTILINSIESIKALPMLLDLEKNYGKIDINISQDEKIHVKFCSYEFRLDFYPKGIVALWETFFRKIYDIPISPDGIIIDVGAFIGDTCVFFVKEKKAKKVIALEPSSYLFRILKENIRLNEIVDNCILLNAALGANRGIRDFYYNLSHPGSSSLFTAPSRKYIKEYVNVITLDQLILDLDIDIVDLLKMDCEGCEYEIFFYFLRNKKILEKIRWIVMEVHKLSSKKANLLKKMINKLGLRIMRILNLGKNEAIYYILCYD